MRAIKEMGWTGFSVNDALNPLSTMGQKLFEPPDVAGWDLGQAWFSTGAMLARMNFASQLATNQKFKLRDVARRRQVQSPEALVSWSLDRLTAPTFPRDSYNALIDYARAGGAWTGSDAQLATKASGLAHLIVGSRRIPAGMRSRHVHPTRVHSWRRRGVHLQLRRAGVPVRSGARAGPARRNLVVLYLSGGNDALSMLVPYNDPVYRSRRPVLGDSRRPTCCRSAAIARATRSACIRASPA